MSIKDLFKSVGSTKTISVDSAEEIRNDAESTAYIMLILSKEYIKHIHMMGLGKKN